MIEWIEDRDCFYEMNEGSSSPSIYEVTKEAQEVIDALRAGQVMHDTIDIFLDLEPSAERGCLATYCDLKKSKEAWDKATKENDDDAS